MGRGRELALEWHEDVRSLYQRYRQERAGRRRMRLHAFWLLRQGHPLTVVAPWIGVDYRTLQRWVAWYRQEGLAGVLDRTPGHGAPGRRGWLSAEQQAALVREASTGRVRTATDAQAWLEGTWGVRYSRKGIYNVFRRLDLRKKAPRPQAERASPEAQEAWKKGG